MKKDCPPGRHTISKEYWKNGFGHTERCSKCGAEWIQFYSEDYILNLTEKSEQILESEPFELFDRSETRF
jgi:hypothetical protein